MVEDPADVEHLVARATELAEQVQSFQSDLGISGRVDSLQKQATANSSDILKGRRARRWVTAALIVAVLFTGTVAYNTIQLQQLVHTECVRSVRGAALRVKLIEDLTKHVVLPAQSDPSQISLVQIRNQQLDTERSDLLAISDQIPKVKC